MPRKCCVPKCSSNALIPLHRFPKSCAKAELWIRAIGLTEMIGASKQTLDKLRICTQHFSDDMVIADRSRRCLQDNALPILNLSSTSNIVQTDSITSSNNIVNEQIIENIENTPVLPHVERHEESQITCVALVNMQDVQHTCRKLRKRQKNIHKKKLMIKAQHQLVNRLRHRNKWEDVITSCNIQRMFFDIIEKNFRNTSQGNLYEAKEKALALTFYKTMGKHAYMSLREIFSYIPSIQTLQSVLQKVPMSSGLTSLILTHLKNISLKMSDKEKVCLLMWDEMPIQSSVTYDMRKDIISGFEDWGTKRTNKIADHVLVFMLRGLYSGWKMPISYSFCNKQTINVQLVYCIRQHIHKINNAGFHIVATVCDESSFNVDAIKKLLLCIDMKWNVKEKKQRNVEIIPLYDPPRLLKSVRNNLLTKDLALNCKNNIPQDIASWDIIKMAWKMDRKMNTIRPQLKKLKTEHIIENKIKKTHVVYASQVLSGTVASFIETLARSKYIVSSEKNSVAINEDAIATAKAVNFLNNLFDSVNGDEKTQINDNELRCPVTEDSAHHMFWVNAKSILYNMKYITKLTHEIINSVPALRNWIFTINSFQKIWKVLNIKYGFNKLNTRYCNLDPLDNFFGQIRSHAVRYSNPTSRQFEDSFITLLVSSMKSIAIICGICETVDNDCILFSLEQFLKDDISSLEVHYNNESADLCIGNHLNEKSIVTLLFEHLPEITKLILKDINYCLECENSLKSSEFFVCARKIIGVINKLLKTRAYRSNIQKVLSNFFENWYINMDWYECIDHRVDIFKTMVQILSNKTIMWWCIKRNALFKDKI